MTYPVFLSSLTAKLPDQDLREQIYFRAGEARMIYVDEEINNRLKTNGADLAIADELLERIHEANTFLCILAGNSHGSRLHFADTISSVSFFEIELFAAALQQKQIIFLVHNDFTPDPILYSLLNLRSFAFPGWRILDKLSSKEIVDAAARIAHQAMAPPRKLWTLSLVSNVQRIAQALYIGRGRHGQKVLYLNGATTDTPAHPNLELVEQILRTDEQLENHENRLSRLWLAVRELNGSAISAQTEPRHLDLFEAALERWSGAGAWYGLHADMPLGCLAAINTIHEIRRQRQVLGTLPRATDPYPAGELASAKFNVAKHLYLPQDRRARLREALDDINRALKTPPEDSSGLLAVRGSIYRRLGRVFDSASDLEKSLLVRQQLRLPVTAIGGTMVELGFTYLYSLRVRKGLRLCEKGVAKLREGGRDVDIARGLRKLAVAYAANVQFRDARRANEESRHLALKTRSFDQVR